MPFSWYRLAICSIVLIFSATVSAQQRKNYAEVQISFLSYDMAEQRIGELLTGGPFNFDLSEVNGYTTDVPDLGVKVVEGVEFNKYFALEGALAWYGELSADFTADDLEVADLDNDGDLDLTGNTVIRNFSYKAKAYGLQVAALAQYPIRDWIVVFVKGGGNLWRLETTLNPDKTGQKRRRDDNSISPIYGAGIRITINDSITFSASWEQTEVAEIDLSSANAGIGFRF